jgi:glycosyltransferase involved in cell wall biosynthesis
MIDLSVIILTYNEEKHINRCINKLSGIAKDIYIVDCFSSDQTVDIASELKAKVFNNKWPGNQAAQFNWALKNLPIKTEWVLRIDADEYLLPELVTEIEAKITSIPQEINGIVFKRRHIFLGKWIKRGTYPVKLLRLFRFGKAMSEQKLMDEHIVLIEGKSLEFDNDFVDENLGTLTYWTEKHNNYSIREALELLDIEIGLSGVKNSSLYLSKQAEEKRAKKLRYARQPLFIRALVYFIYRYFLKLGFLEGKEGFLWHFLQGWWYRTLVDAKIFEIKKACGIDKEKIKDFIKKNYLIDI